MFNFCSARFSLTCCFSFCSSQPFPFPQLLVVTEMVSFLPVKMHSLAVCLLLVLPGPPSCFWCWMMLFHDLAWVCFVPTAFSVWSMSHHFSSVPCEHCVQLCDFPHYLPCCASLLSTRSCASSLCMCCLSSVYPRFPACVQVFQSVHWPQSIEHAHIPGSSGQ